MILAVELTELMECVLNVPSPLSSFVYTLTNCGNSCMESVEFSLWHGLLIVQLFGVNWTGHIAQLFTYAECCRCQLSVVRTLIWQFNKTTPCSLTLYLSVEMAVTITGACDANIFAGRFFWKLPQVKLRHMYYPLKLWKNLWQLIRKPKE